MLSNPKVAITMWNKIKGYQVKGTKILNNLKQYEDILSCYKKHLENKGVNYKDIKFIYFNIEEIYHVTPGSYAGKKIEI